MRAASCRSRARAEANALSNGMAVTYLRRYPRLGGDVRLLCETIRMVLRALVTGSSERSIYHGCRGLPAQRSYARTLTRPT